MSDGGGNRVTHQSEPGMAPLCSKLCRMLRTLPTGFFLGLEVRLEHRPCDSVCLFSIHMRDDLP
jgi:hypothetical protein